ncbi:MAG: hypothetical protein PVG06_15785 [Desulfobacterales bacterium]|jgi:hypothetical protein
MECQVCGEKTAKGVKVCKQCKEEAGKDKAVQGRPQSRSLTANQEATLAAIRKFEKENTLRLGPKGSYSKKYGKQLMKAGKRITPKQQLKLKNMQLIKRFNNIKIPMAVPLNLPEDVIEKIKNEEIKNIILERIANGKRLKLSYKPKKGKVKEITKSKATAFSGHLPLKTHQKIPFVGMGVLQDGKKSKLDMLIPESPNSLISKTTKNQGDILYKKDKAREPDQKKSETEMGTADDGLNNMLSDLIAPGTVSNLLGLSQQRLDNVAWHDFSYYEYVVEPEWFSMPDGIDISQTVIDILNQLEGPSLEVNELLGFIGEILYTIDPAVYWSIWKHNHDGSTSFYWHLYHVADHIVQVYRDGLINSGALSTLYEIYFSITYEWRQAFLNNLRNTLFDYAHILDIFYRHQSGDFSTPPQILTEWIYISNSLLELMQPQMISEEGYQRIKQEVESLMDYPFQIVLPGNVNLGLRLVYRQEWRPLGIQRGETVKTIPLGPKQVEKVSTKITRRTKVSRTAESLKSVETTTETTDSSKDSSEIVKESAETNKWNAEAEAGLDLGFFKVGGGGGGSGESEEKVKRASTHLTETMQKTASKLRTETKIVVSTESESTFEVTTASEIQNPNDEIPITYVFSKLQRQYEVLTRLAEVNSVVFIAEPIPLPHQVTKEWVAKYDWIIAKTLLDDSFRDALISISQDAALDDMPMEKIDTMMDTATNSLLTLASKAGNASLENIDVIQEAQKAYRESHKANLEKGRNRYLLDHKRQRLLQHIRDNILHYCRAIWSQEDPEQRMLRYKKLDIRIPTIWRFVIEADTDIPITGWSVAGLPLGVKGHFEPVLSDVDTVRPVTELINPAGPIGFAGNYAIYYLKPDAEIDLEEIDNLFDMLHLMRNFYMDLETGEFLDPVLRAMQDPDSSSYIPFPQPIPKKQRKEMVDYVPEIRAEYQDLNKSEKEAFIADGLLPNERDEYNKILRQNEKKIFLKEHSCFENANLFYEYLFRKEYSRRFLVDTNNLILDLEAGTGSAMETFKKLHRYFDVLKVIEEKEKMKKENQRRQGLLDDKDYGDPDIEQVILVSASDQLASLIAGMKAGSKAGKSGSRTTGRRRGARKDG